MRLNYRRFDWHRDYRRECEQEYEPVCEHGGSYDCEECEKKMEIENEIIHTFYRKSNKDTILL
jgi:hypothetical protein